MYVALSFLLLSLTFVVHGLPTSHIIGGTDAPVGKYPHHVALKYDGRFRCGGSIISKRYILTAAHCVNTLADPKKLVVHAGTIYLNETGDVYQTESTVWHAGFDDYRLNNDIGLIRVNRDIVFSNVIKPIAVAQEDSAGENTPCVVSGWGRTSVNGPTPNTLQELALKVYSPEKCKRESWQVTDNHICTLTKAGEGVCFGDSGSALLANGAQIGIASFVVPCALGIADKFTKVYAYRSWLEEHTVDVVYYMFLFLFEIGRPSTHIVGGNDAFVGGYPYMVSLRQKNNHFCGGSIIAKRYILTAAHCLASLTDPNVLKDVTVNAGTNFLNKTGYAYAVEKVIIHTDFDMNFIRNDIGLLRLKRDITYNKVVQPISLANNDSVAVGELCFLTGWGKLKFLGKIPNKLQKLDLKVYSQAKCKLLWDVLDSQICAFSQYGQGACHGDSGSPLVANGVQIGLASFVQPCAVGYPDVYTRVSTFKDWIVQHISK
ncbi:serine protease 53 [Ooceraea biroi]|nr:serine protease 53 [Ooceraea biroi]